MNRTCVLMGKEKIPIKKEEMEQIKKFDTPSLKLIGFKNVKKLKPYHNVSNSYFIYPDDEAFFFISVNIFLIIKSKK